MYVYHMCGPMYVQTIPTNNNRTEHTYIHSHLKKFRILFNLFSLFHRMKKKNNIKMRKVMFVQTKLTNIILNNSHINNLAN